MTSGGHADTSLGSDKMNSSPLWAMTTGSSLLFYPLSDF